MESTIDRRGRATIPKPVREQLGLKPGDRVKFFVHPGGSVVLLPTRPVSTLRGIVEGGQGPVTVEEMEKATVEGAINGAVDRQRR